jgi:hypothetical protein
MFSYDPARTHEAMIRLVEQLYACTHDAAQVFHYYHVKNVADEFALFTDVLKQHAAGTLPGSFSPFELQQMMAHLEVCGHRQCVELPALPTFAETARPATSIADVVHQGLHRMNELLAPCNEAIRRVI